MRYKLLKDLPFAKAGCEVNIGRDRFGNFNFRHDAEFFTWKQSWGDPRESEWFTPIDDKEVGYLYYTAGHPQKSLSQAVEDPEFMQPIVEKAAHKAMDEQKKMLDKASCTHQWIEVKKLNVHLDHKDTKDCFNSFKGMCFCKKQGTLVQCANCEVTKELYGEQPK